jgi:hypothetical protein
MCIVKINAITVPRDRFADFEHRFDVLETEVPSRG